MLSSREQLDEIEKVLRGNKRTASFISPLFATCWASLLRSGQAQNIELRGKAETYADTIGLLSVQSGSNIARQPVAGRTYSSLVELHSPAEVDLANAAINELICLQLENYPNVAGQACQIVGELHDNVPAHAGGTGFSMAQFYPSAGLLEIAVSDNGRGMLRNVQRVDDQIMDHQTAIEWCMSEGHTSAAEPDDWAQWIPEDSLQNPYQDNVQTRSSHNHHAGLGLWKLEQIVKATEGTLLVWSGDACLLIEGGQRRFETTETWNGVAIALRLPIAKDAALDGQSRLQELEALAQRLNL